MNVTKLVSSIEYAYATDVSVIRVSPTKVKVSEHTNWTKICTKPFPNLIISDKMEAKNKLWTAELDFLQISLYRHIAGWYGKLDLATDSLCFSEMDRDHIPYNSSLIRHRKSYR